MEKISVIVPVYRVEQYLDRCVESIRKQTYENLEIILVDDGSPDNCPAMCDAWGKKDSRIRVIHKPNGGLSDARNAGMKIASGEYIGFVDSDDWIAPEMYEKLLTAMQRDGSDIGACAVQMVWEGDVPSQILTRESPCVLTRNEAQAELLLERKLKQPVWYKLYRRETIKNISFEKGKYHEDVFWSYQAIGNCKKVSIIDDIGYFYWQRNDSIMGNGYSLKRLDAMEAYCNRYEYMKSAFPQLEKAALRRIYEGCIYQGQMAQKFLKKKERNVAFQKLKLIIVRYPISCSDYAEEKITHKLWIGLSRIDLRLVCKVKNWIGIGL